MEDLRFAEKLSMFVDVAQARSFSAVARRKGLVASSVARQIDALEAELKVALFTRSTRALVPTDAGNMLFERAVKILHDLSDARDEVVSLERNVSGLLRALPHPSARMRAFTEHLIAGIGEPPAWEVAMRGAEGAPATPSHIVAAEQAGLPSDVLSHVSR